VCGGGLEWEEEKQKEKETTSCQTSYEPGRIQDSELPSFFWGKKWVRRQEDETHLKNFFNEKLAVLRQDSERRIGDPGESSRDRGRGIPNTHRWWRWRKRSERCGGLIGLRSNIELRVDEIAVPEELQEEFEKVCQMV
jgi:hypothetical protein